MIGHRRRIRAIAKGFDDHVHGGWAGSNQSLSVLPANFDAVQSSRLRSTRFSLTIYARPHLHVCPVPHIEQLHETRRYLRSELIVTMTAGAGGVWMFCVQLQFEDAYWERGKTGTTRWRQRAPCRVRAHRPRRRSPRACARNRPDSADRKHDALLLLSGADRYCPVHGEDHARA